MAGLAALGADERLVFSKRTCWGKSKAGPAGSAFVFQCGLRTTNYQSKSIKGQTHFEGKLEAGANDSN